MRAILDFIVFVIFIVFVFHLSNLADRLKSETELKKRGIINHLDRVVCVKGSPDLKGSIMSLHMYKDRLSIDETLSIPLNKVKIAQTFKINEVRVSLLCKMKTNHYLSIEFTDHQDNDGKIIFLVDIRTRANSFAAGINQQVGNILCPASELGLS